MVFKLLQLFIAFFKVGLLSFGGGYTLIPIIEQQVVDVYQWIGHDEFMRILGASQAIPGAISIKFASYVGYKEAGIIGAIVSITASIIVPMAAILILFNILNKVDRFPVADRSLKAIKSATWGLVLGFGVQALLKTQLAYKNLLIGILAFLALVVLKISPAIIVIIAGLIGLILYK
ncbi:chromate transporter [Alkaliphilus serpentinus]|uniref:Chromate transporter n=1 Tax=Alkaliphilus serpentinus TaxID=1482731 RepID=A0A833HLF3_9FIRM|nr:chromate transporter [Alkaliphilus serpentinus]KAB3525738.1 chromate transporter [Alkaliphilus serpentinus]